MSFGWGTKWTSWKNPISFTLHPLEFCLLRYHDGLQNQRSRQNDGGHPKQNPANNYGNRFSSSWSRQDKFDRGKPIKPISSCPEKWRVAPKRDGFLAKTLSLTAVGEDTPPSPSSKREDSSKCCEWSQWPLQICHGSFSALHPPWFGVIVNWYVQLHTNQDLDRHWSLTVSIAEWHFGVFWEVVHLCECSNKRNHFQAHPGATVYTVYTSSCQCYCHRQAWLRKVSRASGEENSPSVPIMYRDASHK